MLDNHRVSHNYTRCSMIISEQQRKNRGYKQTVGNFSSCKMKTSFWYNSLLQKDFMYWLEFDPDVVSYKTLAIQLEYYINGKQKRHAPDFQVIRHQKKQIIEVKSQKIIKSEKYRRLYPLLLKICDETGWEFIVITESQVRQEPLLSNIKLLYKYGSKEYVKSEYTHVTNDWASHGLMETLKVDNGTDFRSKSLIEQANSTDEIVISSEPVLSNINSGISDFSSAVELDKKAEEIAVEIVTKDTIDPKSETNTSKTRTKSKQKARKKSVADKSKTKLTNQQKSTAGKKQKDYPKVKQHIEDEVSETSSSPIETKERQPQQEKKSRATIGLPQWKPPSR